MGISNPYLERQVYSPQATAGRGIRSTVGQRFYGGLSQNVTPTPTPMPVQRPQEAMYAPEPMPMVDPQLFSGDGVGEAGEGLVGPDQASPEALAALGLPSTPPKGILGHAKAGFDFLTKTMNPFILAPRLMIKGATGQLGGKAEGAPVGLPGFGTAVGPGGGAPSGWGGGSIGVSPGIGGHYGGGITGGAGGVSDIGLVGPEGGFVAAGGHAGKGATFGLAGITAAPPTSGLADMGFGDGGGGVGAGGLGGFGTGFGHGGFGAGATGGFGGGGEGTW